MFEQYIGINARQHKMSSSVQPRARILVRCCGPRDMKGVLRPHHDPSSTACHRGRYSGVSITSLAMVEVATAMAAVAMAGTEVLAVEHRRKTWRRQLAASARCQSRRIPWWHRSCPDQGRCRRRGRRLAWPLSRSGLDDSNWNR